MHPSLWCAAHRLQCVDYRRETSKLARRLPGSSAGPRRARRSEHHLQPSGWYHCGWWLRRKTVRSLEASEVDHIVPWHTSTASCLPFANILPSWSSMYVSSHNTAQHIDGYQKSSSLSHRHIVEDFALMLVINTPCASATSRKLRTSTHVIASAACVGLGRKKGSYDVLANHDYPF